MRSFRNVTWGAAYGVLSRRPTPWFPEGSKGLPSQCTVKGNEVWAECSVATAGAWAVVEPCLLPQHTGSTRWSWVHLLLITTGLTLPEGQMRWQLVPLRPVGLEIGIFIPLFPRLFSLRCKRTKDVGCTGSPRGASWQLLVSSHLYQGS